MKINFPGKVQKCEVCHDWIVSPENQSPVETCPYCGAAQYDPRAAGRKGYGVTVKSKGDWVSGRDAALISLRLQQYRIKARASEAKKGSVSLSSAGEPTSIDPYPAPDGDFKPTYADIKNDHVLLGNVALIGVDFVFAAFGLIPYRAAFELSVGIIAVGTVVDTWVHQFFH